MKQKEVSKGPDNKKGNLSAFDMRNLAPGPKVSLTAAAVILITLAVWPVGRAEAENVSLAESKNEKSSADGNISLKPKRSLSSKVGNFADRTLDRTSSRRFNHNKWDAGDDATDDDVQYSLQSDSFGNGAGDVGYENDGYGYDDDEYDHLTGKRFDDDTVKLSEEVTKERNTFDKGLSTEKSVNVPDSTTIQLLSFQAKNISPGSEDINTNDVPKMKTMGTGAQKPYSTKDSLGSNSLKKTNDNKPQDMKDIGTTGNDKNTGQIKIVDSKDIANKPTIESRTEAAKVADAGAANQMNQMNQINQINQMDAQKLKDNSVKENNAIGKDSKFSAMPKNEVKIADKDVKRADSKTLSEESDASSKLKDGKDMDGSISEGKANADAEKRGQESNVAELVSNDYKESFENMSGAGITDDEKGVEEKNVAGLRDTRNELPYIKDPLKNVRKKGAIRRNLSHRSEILDNTLEDKQDRVSKEPYHLDFPLADLENTDYHRNFIKSLKRFKGLDESDRILCQGDAPSPYADQNKKQIAPQVIEEEQRKRRSRLRRLKASPFFVRKRDRDEDECSSLYAYGQSIRARMPYGGSFDDAPRYSNRGANTGMYRRNMDRPDMNPQDDNYIFDSYEEDDDAINVKNKRQDDDRLNDSDAEDEGDEDYSYPDRQYETERLSPYPVKRKSSSQKEYEPKLQKRKFKEQSTPYEDSPRPNGPLLLVQRKDNGLQSMKSFDAKHKSEETVNSEDLAKLLSRDGNYVVLRKVPGKNKAQKVYDAEFGGRPNEAVLSEVSETGRKEKFKGPQSEYALKERTIPIFDQRRMGMETVAESTPKKKDDRFINLSELLKDSKIDEKKDMIVTVEKQGDRGNMFRRGESSKKFVYKTPLQDFRRPKDFEGNSDRYDPAIIVQRDVYRQEDKPEKVGMATDNRILPSPERMVKSFKKEGKEVVLLNRPYNAIAVKTKSQEAVVQDLGGSSPSRENPLPPLSMYIPFMTPLVPPVQPSGAATSQSQVAPNQNPQKMSLQNFAMQNMVPQSPQMGQQAMNNPMTNPLAMFPGLNINPNANKGNTYGKPTGLAEGSVYNANLVVGKKAPNPLQNNYIPPQNGLMNTGVHMQITLPDFSNKNQDLGRKYFLYGSQNYDRPNTPMHDVKVIQQEYGPQFPYTETSQNYDPKQQTYSKTPVTLMKNTESGKAIPVEKSGVLPSHNRQNPAPYDVQKPNAYSGKQQWLANVFQLNNRPMDMYDNYKTIVKKDISERRHPLSGSLKRFMRDFQGLNQPFISNVYTEQTLPGISLKELTSHSNKHLEKLNNFLKEIITNKMDDIGNDNKKTFKRGMKYKDQKGWQLNEGGSAPHASSGKWTSIDYGSAMDYRDRNYNSGESLLKDAEAMTGEEPDAHFSKRSKRSLNRCEPAMKDSTDALEVKIKSIPYKVEPQPLSTYSNGDQQQQQTQQQTQQQQQKTNSRSYMILPPDKLMDLLNVFSPAQGLQPDEKISVKDICKRDGSAGGSGPNAAVNRKSEGGGSRSRKKRQAEGVRKSFGIFMDPLAKKSNYRKGGRKRRRRREIELDESTPNDFQNFLMTSLGGLGSQKREVVKKEEAIWESEGQHDGSNQIVDGMSNRDPNEGSTVGKREISDSKMDSRNGKDDSTKIRIRIVDGSSDGELIAKASEIGDNSPLTPEEEKGGLRDENNPGVHEVYLIAKSDRKKKKYATPRSDQTLQKQPISSHLPQVETVYNPSPGSNKAQIEKISDQKYFAKPQTYYNGSATAFEGSDMHPSHRAGNMNSFAYQTKDEHAPYPVQGPSCPVRSFEFERLESHSPSRSMPYSRQQFSIGDHYASLTNNQEIIYKDENSQKANVVVSSRSGSPKQQTFMSLRRETGKEPFRGGNREGSNPNSLHPDYSEDGPAFTEQRASNTYPYRGDYDIPENGEVPERSAFNDEIEELEENVNPKMVEMWKNYAKTHLTPASHKEAMDREFKEAYLRTGASQMLTSKLAGDVMKKDKFGASLIKSLNQQDYDRLTKDKSEFMGQDRTREKVGKRSTQNSNTRPVEIGRRLFYSFKTEIPAQEYYTIYADPVRLRNSLVNRETSTNGRSDEVEIDVQRQKLKRKSREIGKRDSVENVIGGYIVRKSVSDRGENGGENRAKRKSELYEARNDFPESRNRVKRSEGCIKSAGKEKVIEKRLSSGHLTESHFRKYHRKNFGGKRFVDGSQGGGGQLCPEKRVKRDSLSDTLKTDLSRRMEEEKRARMMVKNFKVEFTKEENPYCIGNFIPMVSSAADISEIQGEDKKKKLTEESKHKEAVHQQQECRSHGKSETPDIFKTFDIKRGRRKNRQVKRASRERARHTILGRAHSGHRKDKKISEEGFEPLTPDARFSERSTSNHANRDGIQALTEEGPYKVSLGESNEPDRKVDRNRAAGKGAPKQFTHGFSHEAPLLTPINPLDSPKIFDALKWIHESESKDGHGNDADVRGSVDETALQLTKAAKVEEAKSDPFIGAVLVLAKRENKNPDEGDEIGFGGVASSQSRHSEVKKRNSDWNEEMSEEPMQSLEIASLFHSQ
ncbi:UNVERIFIED_CONTAM: hypothetical protein PYX00_010019 [Menopon gallinae]|uniref:Uncharacterized protein n=2 Tax=Menopon gallinae TaxID=328185 RepID=A0AAW2HDD3_9NEOP